jgi:Domain of unknown function (DUF5069)
MTPLDLTKGRPRRPHEQLDGIVFLPRTIDKARALLPGGNKGDYNVAPGISEGFLKHFGLTPDAFIEAVKNASSDADVVKWFRANSDASKTASWNEDILGRVLSEANRERVSGRHPIAKDMPDGTAVVDVLEADDRACLGEKFAVAS